MTRKDRIEEIAERGLRMNHDSGAKAWFTLMEKMATIAIPEGSTLPKFDHLLRAVEESVCL